MFVFFFFQAEDGIRDFHVTGVQTCALPISTASGDTARARARSLAVGRDRRLARAPRVVSAKVARGDPRDQARAAPGARQVTLDRYPAVMEGGGFGFPLGGDPEDLLRGLREFAEQQAESVQEAQREQFATLTLNTAVDLTSAALKRMSVEGGPDEQAVALRDAMRVLFPEAVALVSAARQGFMRET